MRTSICVTTAAAALSVMLTASVSAQLASGSYSGQLDCAKMPFTKGAQRAAVQFRVDGGAATYSRTVGNEDNSANVGTESGSGTISADGTTSLSGGWKGSRDSYSASYTGKVGPKGGKLSGQQNWTYKGQAYTRACSMTVIAR